MPMDDGPPTPALVLWAAKRVITQHSELANPDRAAGTCKQCRDDGCPQLAWAIANVKANRQAGDRPDRYTEPVVIEPLVDRCIPCITATDRREPDHACFDRGDGGPYAHERDWRCDLPMPERARSTAVQSGSDRRVTGLNSRRS